MKRTLLIYALIILIFGIISKRNSRNRAYANNHRSYGHTDTLKIDSLIQRVKRSGGPTPQIPTTFRVKLSADNKFIITMEIYDTLRNSPYVLNSDPARKYFTRYSAYLVKDIIGNEYLDFVSSVNYHCHYINIDMIINCPVKTDTIQPATSI
jgi:hypothetical protein